MCEWSTRPSKHKPNTDCRDVALERQLLQKALSLPFLCILLVGGMQEGLVIELLSLG